MNNLKVCYYYCSYHFKDLFLNLTIEEAREKVKELKSINTTPFVDYKIHIM